MGEAKSEKETKLKYKFQPFARQFFDAISLIQLPAANDIHVFISVNIFEDTKLISHLLCLRPSIN
jgi:hypothetical protein